MSLAEDDLGHSPSHLHRSARRSASRRPRDEPPAATEVFRPDQRYKGYASSEYAMNNPWYGQPRSSPVFGLAESLPHTVRQGQASRHEKREQEALYRREPDVERGEGRGEGQGESYRRGRDREAVRLGSQDATAEEKLDRASSEKRRSKFDADEPQSPTIRPKNKEEAAEEETKGKKEEKEEVEEEEEERQASYDRHRNAFAQFRARYPDILAEYLATTITIFLAICGNLSYRFNRSYGTYETLCWTNGFATMAGIYLAGGVSGAHINPIISIVLAVYRGFPWHKVWIYMLAQLFGSLTAGGLAYSVYHDAIHTHDPGLTSLTGQSFYTIPQREISVSSAFWSEFISIATFVCIVFALGDDQNSPPGAGMNALIIGFVYTLIGLSLGYNTGPCMNPMRDMATRLVALMVGYGRQTFRNWWWIGGCWGGDLAGAMTGAAVYNIFIFTGSESPVNYLWPAMHEVVGKLKRIVRLRWKR
ncbi:hypothetical protein CNMCM6936_002720 [Aspergillus lentulus]|nr:hypothetical protein CNMCM6936_002720 [Aspergillus lentulus]